MKKTNKIMNLAVAGTLSVVMGCFGGITNVQAAENAVETTAENTAETVSGEMSVEDMNKNLIYYFYTKFFNEHDVDSALDCVREDYIQHNPGVGQGRTALMDAFREKFITEPDFHLEVEMIIADGNMAAVYLRNVGADGVEKCKLVDIYRIEEGKLAEHWDIIQKSN